MVVNDIGKHIAIGKEIIVYSKTNLNVDYDLKIRYKIEKENKEIRLYDVPRILTFQEKVMIYYAILDTYYFHPLKMLNKDFRDVKIEEFIVKENGYTYNEFNGIDKPSKGILGELLFEIPRQSIEAEKLSKIRDIYEMLIRNVEEVGIKPICIDFIGLMPDFKDVYRIIEYMFKFDDKLSKKQNDVILFKRSGIFGGSKRIFIVPKKINKTEQENNS